MESPLVADHPALDLMNTVARVEGEEVDFLETDADVLLWLVRAGLVTEEEARKTKGKSGALKEAAVTLREAIRRLVHRRKEGKAADPSVLNAYLREGASHPELVWEGPGAPRLERKRERRTPEQLLAPLAESAAALLSTADFELIRPCANHECVLWFHDRTKSHRRRWCSMAACGNRHKVAAFRQRQGE